MADHSDFAAELAEAIRNYNGTPCEERLFSVLGCLFKHFCAGNTLTCPVKIRPCDGDMSFDPLFLRTSAGKEHLVLLTQQDTDLYPEAVTVSVHTIMRLLLSSDECEGFVIDPGDEGGFFLPKRLFVFALHAGYRMAMEDYGLADDEDESGDGQEANEEERAASADDMMKIADFFDGIDYTMLFGIHDFPASRYQLEGLLDLTETLEDEPEHLLRIVLNAHDDPREIWLARQAGGFRMVFAFPMDDFGWPVPLLLCGDDLSSDEVEELLTGICLEGRETDSFPLVEDRFRDVTGAVFGDFEVPEEGGPND